MSGPVLGGAAQAGPQEGQQPTPVQIEAMRQQIIADAAKHGMSPEQYLAQLRTHAMRQSQQQQQSQAGAQSQQPHSHDGHEHSHDHPHQQQQEQQIPITPGEPTPQALALQKWLRSQDLKSRPCILKDQRKDMFKGAVTLL